MRDIIAGCCQFSIKPARVDENLATVEGALSELAKRDCQLAVLPEMWSCSFPYAVLQSMAERTPGLVSRLREIARGKRLVITGSLPDAEDGKIYNTNYVIDSSGEVAGTYRKVHLFSLYNEHRHFGKGGAAPVFDTSIGKIGVMTCYDLRFPELARKMALAGAEILCVSALWPVARADHWSLFLRARAVENQLFVVGCNGCGSLEKIPWGGTSALISPSGTAIAEAGPGDQTILGRLPVREKEDFRNMIPCFDDRAPEVYGSCEGS